MDNETRNFNRKFGRKGMAFRDWCEKNGRFPDLNSTDPQERKVAQYGEEVKKRFEGERELDNLRRDIQLLTPEQRKRVALALVKADPGLNH